MQPPGIYNVSQEPEVLCDGCTYKRCDELLSTYWQE
jgi:hypothetical protein